MVLNQFQPSVQRNLCREPRDDKNGFDRQIVVIGRNAAPDAHAGEKA